MKETRGASVLCVDDDAAILSALRRTLHREPYDVLTAPSASLALACLDRLPVEVVIADYRMPTTSGTQLLAEVRQRWPWMGRVILTAYAGPSVIIRGLEAGIDFLLYKPWDDEALRRTVRRLLHEVERTRAQESEIDLK